MSRENKKQTKENAFVCLCETGGLKLNPRSYIIYLYLFSYPAFWRTDNNCILSYRYRAYEPYLLFCRKAVQIPRVRSEYAKTKVDESVIALKEKVKEAESEIDNVKNEIYYERGFRKFMFWATPILLFVQGVMLAIAFLI